MNQQCKVVPVIICFLIQIDEKSFGHVLFQMSREFFARQKIVKRFSPHQIG